MKKDKDNLIVSTVMGEKYTKAYEEVFKDSQTSFAKKIQTEFLYITKDIEFSTKHKHPSWQKMLMFKDPRIAQYSHILFIDADVYVTRHAKNPFEVVGDVPWSMADNNPYKVKYLTDNDLKLYDHCPPENRPKIMLNAGVFIVTKESQPVLEKVFYDYEEQPCYDNGPVSYHLLNGPKGKLLPSEFNQIVWAYREAFGKGLSTILRMYEESSFLHFAGKSSKTYPTLQIIKYIDTHPSSFLTKVIYLAGRKYFDFITAPLLKLIKYVRENYRGLKKKLTGKQTDQVL